MNIFPAIDIFGGKAVRLFKGNYDEMTVYSDYPEEIAADFKAQGAKYMHLVDLEGAKTGGTPNAKTIEKLVEKFGGFTEVGGGIRSIKAIDEYTAMGVNRVILGTVAVTDRKFLSDALKKYGDKIAVGVDIKDGFVAIKGWTEKSSLTVFDFIKELENSGVKTIICTDISKDGAMKGTNHALYETLCKSSEMQIIASGGVSSVDDLKRLASLGVYGAIIGKAYYEKAISIKRAIEVAK